MIVPTIRIDTARYSYCARGIAVLPTRVRPPSRDIGSRPIVSASMSISAAVFGINERDNPLVSEQTVLDTCGECTLPDLGVIEQIWGTGPLPVYRIADHAISSVSSLPCDDVPGGSEVAGGVRSRGIANPANIVEGVVPALETLGYRPFVFPTKAASSGRRTRCISADSRYLRSSWRRPMTGRTSGPSPNLGKSNSETANSLRHRYPTLTTIEHTSSDLFGSTCTHPG